MRKRSRTLAEMASFGVQMKVEDEEVEGGDDQ